MRFKKSSNRSEAGRFRKYYPRVISPRQQGLPSGTYLIEVENSDYFYEPIRVDINSKGKHRARKNSLIQPNQVLLPYLFFSPVLLQALAQDLCTILSTLVVNVCQWLRCHLN